MKHSPGCKCCKSCRRIPLKWAPSSPYDRGEYTDDDQWKPYTEYLQFETFWAQSTDRNGDIQKFLYQAPVTMFSGGGWTNAEEQRYVKLRGISYYDRLDDFYLVGDRWPHDEIDLHEYLQERKLTEGQGIVSVKQHIEKDYYVSWYPSLNSTEQYDSYDMPSLHIDIQALCNVDHDPDSELMPTSGLLSSIKKALPEERFQGPYPGNCIPSCSALTETIWNPDDPACGNKPPHSIEMVARHGTLVDSVEDLSNHYRNVTNSLAQARSFQPQNGAVTETLDVEAELAASGETAVNLHGDRTWGGEYAGLSNRKGNPYLQNQVMVVTTAGKVNTGETVVDVEAGDVIRIDDFTKVGENLDAAFEIIKAVDIVESERTHLFVTRNHWERIFDNTSVERQMNLSAFTGRRVAFLVKDFRDDDFTRTLNGDYSVKFGPTVCTIEDAATVSNPTCRKVPAWECECEELSLLIATPADITNQTKYEYCYPFDGGVVEPEEFDIWTVWSNSGGAIWLGTSPVATVSGRCFARAATFDVASSWTVQDFENRFEAERFIASYGVVASVRAAFQYSEVRVFDCIGKQDKVVMSRSVAGCINTDLTGFAGATAPNWFLSGQEAEAMAVEVCGAQSTFMSTLLNAMICNNDFRFNDDMTAWAKKLIIPENTVETSSGLLARFAWSGPFTVNATPLTMELSRGIGSSCNFAISQNFHPDRSSAFIDEAMTEQEFRFIDFCPSVANIPESQNPEAVSLPNEPTVLATIVSGAPIL